MRYDPITFLLSFQFGKLLFQENNVTRLVSGLPVSYKGEVNRST